MGHIDHETVETTHGWYCTATGDFTSSEALPARIARLVSTHQDTLRDTGIVLGAAASALTILEVAPMAIGFLSSIPNEFRDMFYDALRDARIK